MHHTHIKLEILSVLLHKAHQNIPILAILNIRLISAQIRAHPFMQISSNTILEIHLAKMHIARIMNFICFLYLAVLHDFYINLPAAGFMGNSTVGSIGGKGCLGNMG